MIILRLCFLSSVSAVHAHTFHMSIVVCILCVSEDPPNYIHFFWRRKLCEFNAKTKGCPLFVIAAALQTNLYNLRVRESLRHATFCFFCVFRITQKIEKKANPTDEHESRTCFFMSSIEL